MLLGPRGLTGWSISIRPTTYWARESVGAENLIFQPRLNRGMGFVPAAPAGDPSPFFLSATQGAGRRDRCPIQGLFVAGAQNAKLS